VSSIVAAMGRGESWRGALWAGLDVELDAATARKPPRPPQKSARGFILPIELSRLAPPQRRNARGKYRDGPGVTPMKMHELAQHVDAT